MIRLNCFMQVEPQHVEEVKTLARQLVEASRGDEGCVSYDYFQSTTNPNVLMFCETWKDQNVLDAHAKAAHFTKLVPQIEKFGKMKIEKFEF